MSGTDAGLDNLRHHAARVLLTIEMIDLSACGSNLSAFPNYCCHHAVMLLAFYLYERGWTDLHAAKGTRPGNLRTKHVWLQAGNILVDITADQFGEG